METNKYKGTMYERFDSALTDRMLEADYLVRKLEFINEHIDNEELVSNLAFLQQLEYELVNKSMTPHFKLTYSNGKDASEMLLSILFQTKRIFNEIRDAWLSSRAGYTLTLEECVNNISRRINEKNEFHTVLCNMDFKRNII